MPMLPATQSRPAEAPAPRPSASEGRGPRKVAKFQAARKASTSVSPKILALLPFASCWSLSPASRCQALPNSAGEYHNAPSAKLASVATRTAIQLIGGMGNSLRCRAGDSARRGGGASWKNGKWGHSSFPSKRGQSRGESAGRRLCARGVYLGRVTRTPRSSRQLRDCPRLLGNEECPH